MAKYLKSEYYAEDDGMSAADRECDGAIARPDMHPHLARAIGIEAGNDVSVPDLANILNGQKADGSELPGSQRGVLKYEATETEDGEKVGKTRYRIAYLDCVFAPHKSVSVGWACASPESRRLIHQAHRDAVDSTLLHMERVLGRGRIGGGGMKGEERAYIAWIKCEHYTARPVLELVCTDPETGARATELHPIPSGSPGDPHIHTHCLIPNIMITESGRFVSMNRDLLEGRVEEFIGVYNMHLASNLRDLGIRADRCQDTHAARMPEIPEYVWKHFSKRGNKAEEAARAFAKQQGWDWDKSTDEQRGDMIRDASLRGRGKKASNARANFKAWEEQWESLGWKPPKDFEYYQAPKMSRAERMERAFQTGLSLLEEELSRRAVIDGKDARLAMIRGLIEWGAEGTADIDALVREMVSRGVRQDGRHTEIEYHEINGRVRITTRLHADQESELIGLAQDAAADKSRALTIPEIKAAAERKGFDYSDEHGTAQKKALARVGTGGAATAFVGKAGSGKNTRIASVLVDAWRERGYETWGTAISWSQSRELKHVGIAHDRCIAIDPLINRIKDGRATLNRNSVLVLDELSQIGSRQLLELFRLREKHGFQLVMTGGHRQCLAIEAGDSIELLQRAWGAEAIPQILTTVRQKTRDERYVTGLFYEGKIKEALDRKRWDKTAELVEGGYRQCVDHIASLYVQRRVANAHDPEFTITISAPTNADALEIGRTVRLKRREMGEVGRDVMQSVRCTDRMGNKFSLDLAEGDNLRLFRQTRALSTLQNGKRHTAVIGDNGSVLQVVDIDPAKGLTLRRADGKTGFVSWDRLRDQNSGRLLITYGDCRTIDSNQGNTSDEHIHAFPSGSRMVHSFKNYSAASRHRITSWFVGSMGAELREVTERLPLGAPEMSAPERRAACWDNVIRNFKREPAKENALAFLEKTTHQLADSQRAVHAIKRKQQARVHAGKPKATLAQKIERRQATKVIRHVAEHVQQTIPKWTVIKESFAALRAYEENKEARRASIAARLVVEGRLGYADALDRLIGASIADQSRGLPIRPLHGTKIYPPGLESDESIQDRLVTLLDRALDEADAKRAKQLAALETLEKLIVEHLPKILAQEQRRSAPVQSQQHAPAQSA
jgi:hypothetical protein